VHFVRSTDDLFKVGVFVRFRCRQSRLLMYAPKSFTDGKWIQREEIEIEN
jgi:hypothetical protein